MSCADQTFRARVMGGFGFGVGAALAVLAVSAAVAVGLRATGVRVPGVGG